MEPVPRLNTNSYVTASLRRVGIRVQKSDLFLPFSIWMTRAFMERQNKSAQEMHKQMVERSLVPRKKPVWINQNNYKQLVCSVMVR